MTFECVETTEISDCQLISFFFSSSPSLCTTNSRRESREIENHVFVRCFRLFLALSSLIAGTWNDALRSTSSAKSAYEPMSIEESLVTFFIIYVSSFGAVNSLAHFIAFYLHNFLFIFYFSSRDFFRLFPCISSTWRCRFDVGFKPQSLFQWK